MKKPITPTPSRLPRVWKSLSPTTNRVTVVAAMVLALLLGARPTASAKVLDDFSVADPNGRTAVPNGGVIAQAGGQYTITTATANGSTSYSVKTALPTEPSLPSANFLLAAGHTLEFRVDINAATPGFGDTNALAILGWVPVGGATLANGYAVAVGANDVQIFRNNALVPLYSTNLSLKDTNIILVLRMTPNIAGGGVDVNVRVYKQQAAGSTVAGSAFATVPAAASPVIFEYTVMNDVGGAGLIGQLGNGALGVRNQASATGASVTFDNLQVFDLSNSVLDNFNSNPNLTGWTTFTNPVSVSGFPGHVYAAGGVVDVSAPPSTSGGFAGAYYTKTSKVETNGGRLEYTIDVVQNLTGPYAYTVLGYLPDAASFSTLKEYFIASDVANTTVMLTGKRLGVYASANNSPFPSDNIRYTVSMTGEGANCRVEWRCENLSVDVNDPNRVVWDNVFIDTPAGDLGSEAATGLSAPYMNSDGNIAFSVFNAGGGTAVQPPDWARATFDNATVSQTLQPNAAPIISGVSPAQGANFVASTNCISFTLTDDVNVPSNKIVMTLNGVVYTNGSPGVTVTPPGGSATSRAVTICGILADNVNYTGSISVTDDSSAVAGYPLAFDTFLTNVYVVEIEEYNFSTNALENGGVYLDNPALEGSGFGPDDPATAYNGQTGAPEIDFHDNRGPNPGGINVDHVFRYTDGVRTAFSTDIRRQKYIDAGPVVVSLGDGGFNETEVEDIRDGDWMNYTRAYPAGTYNVYLRQATFSIANSLVTLDLVTSDPTTNGQTIATLGSFIGTPGALIDYRNVPLSDGLGNKVVFRSSGAPITLRLSERNTGNSSATDGILVQNYLAFIPVPDPGVLRPIVSDVSPANGAVIYASAPPTKASIANRDTTVQVGTITLKINGTSVAATVTPTASGADISWCLSVLPPSRMLTNTLNYTDSDGTNVTTSWTYSYPFLSASNSLPPTALTTRGFAFRMVQTDGPALGNSLARAEGQLATPPAYQIDQSFSGLAQELYWNNDTACPEDVPGLSGVCGSPVPLNNISTEALGYIKLTAGAHRFRAVSDDGFQLRSGAFPTDLFATTLGIRDGGTFNGSFDFMVEADGLYPIRNVWYENTGSAVFRLTAVDPCTLGETDINDPADPAGVVKVFTSDYQLDVYSSATVNGTFTLDGAAAVNRNNQTVTVSKAPARKFYKLAGPSATKIDRVSVSGGNVVIHYKFQ